MLRPCFFKVSWIIFLLFFNSSAATKFSCTSSLQNMILLPNSCSWHIFFPFISFLGSSKGLSSRILQRQTQAHTAFILETGIWFSLKASFFFFFKSTETPFFIKQVSKNNALRLSLYCQERHKKDGSPILFLVLEFAFNFSFWSQSWCSPVLQSRGWMVAKSEICIWEHESLSQEPAIYTPHSWRSIFTFCLLACCIADRLGTA